MKLEPEYRVLPRVSFDVGYWVIVIVGAFAILSLCVVLHNSTMDRQLERHELRAVESAE